MEKLSNIKSLLVKEAVADSKTDNKNALREKHELIGLIGKEFKVDVVD